MQHTEPPSLSIAGPLKLQSSLDGFQGQLLQRPRMAFSVWNFLFYGTFLVFQAGALLFMAAIPPWCIVQAILHLHPMFLLIALLPLPMLWFMGRELRSALKDFPTQRLKKIERGPCPFALLPTRLKLGENSWDWEQLADIEVNTYAIDGEIQLEIAETAGGRVVVRGHVEHLDSWRWLEKIIGERLRTHGSSEELPAALQKMRAQVGADEPLA
jgi:hypothetical protein